MLSWILQTTILSIIFIFLIHHLIIFFKENLTVPKVKDLVNAPSQKYKDMYNIISQDKDKDKENYQDDPVIYNKTSYTKEDLLPKPDVENMKNELKSFLKEQLTQSSLSGNGNKNTFSSSSTTEIADLSSYDNSYSSY
jgi:hypothetical protein